MVNMTWTLLESERPKRSLAPLTPILNTINREGQSIKIKVKNQCGEDGICRSDLRTKAKFEMAIETDGISKWHDIKVVLDVNIF